MPKPRALITGISGMVGSHLADYLLEHTDWDIHGMCRWRSPLDNVKHLLDRVNRHDRVFFGYGDLRDYISIQNVVEQAKPDYVFHLAAQSYPMTSFTSPLDTYDTNIEGTARLLEALRRCPGIDPVIHVCSSSEVSGTCRSASIGRSRSGSVSTLTSLRVESDRRCLSISPTVQEYAPPML